jgi:hypothetical protein
MQEEKKLLVILRRRLKEIITKTIPNKEYHRGYPW